MSSSSSSSSSLNGSVQSSNENDSRKWVTRRSHLLISYTHVLPVIFKSFALPSSEQPPVTDPPRAFPLTQLLLSDALPLLKFWIRSKLLRVYSPTHANLRPGTIETTDVLRIGSKRFTVWLQPVVGASAVIQMTPTKTGKKDENGDDIKTHKIFIPTPQTLFVIAEVDNSFVETSS